MGVVIKVEYPASLTGSGKVAKVDEMKPSILLQAGRELAKLLGNWLNQLRTSRSRHGSNHFTSNDVHEPIVEGDTVSVGVQTLGIGRALHDIVIQPVEATKLAIPVSEAAYGMSPREYSRFHPRGTPEALFRPKGKDWLAKNEDGNLVLMYVLKDSVTQKQDRTLLPPDEEMNATISNAVHDAVEAILQN